ncbi:MAG: CHASE2 domain-containing protein [Cyanobacteria bacterium J06635_10]
MSSNKHHSPDDSDEKSVHVSAESNSGNVQATSAGRDAYVSAGDLTVNRFLINLAARNGRKIAFSRVETVAVFSINFFICLALVIARVLGLFEDLELSHYDYLLRSRAEVSPDEHLVIISASDGDYDRQDAAGENQKLGSYSDRELVLLLQKVLLHQPKAVGLDIFRPYGESFDPLYSLLEERDNVLLVCEKAGFSSEGWKGPDWLKRAQNRVGFNNFLYDYDQTVRRAYIGIENANDSKCASNFSFSFLLASKYLDFELSEISSLGQIEESGYRRNVLNRLLVPFYGAYQGLDSSGFQVLINYRPVRNDLKDITNNRFDFSEVMSADFDASIFTDRVILIGISAETEAPSPVKTPYGETKRIFVQAHITSDFIDRMDEKRQDDRVLTTIVQPIILFSVFLICSFSTALTIRLGNHRFLLFAAAFILEFGLFAFSLVAMIWLNVWIPIYIIMISSSICMVVTQVYGLSLAKDIK